MNESIKSSVFNQGGQLQDVKCCLFVTLLRPQFSCTRWDRTQPIIATNQACHVGQIYSCGALGGSSSWSKYVAFQFLGGEWWGYQNTTTSYRAESHTHLCVSGLHMVLQMIQSALPHGRNLLSVTSWDDSLSPPSELFFFPFTFYMWTIRQCHGPLVTSGSKKSSGHFCAKFGLFNISCRLPFKTTLFWLALHFTACLA